MSDSVLKHVIALSGTLVCFLAYWAGYQSGQAGWWWAGFSLIIIYAAIVKLIDV
jgi:hypothetical protein